MKILKIIFGGLLILFAFWIPFFVSFIPYDGGDGYMFGLIMTCLLVGAGICSLGIVQITSALDETRT